MANEKIQYIIKPRIHNCSECGNFNVFNQGLCFSRCKMGNDHVSTWKMIYREDQPGITERAGWK